MEAAGSNLSPTTKTSSPRVTRKKQQTRNRIIREAERLMRSTPIDEVTIADITGAADVGHGTFYLHFNSKYEVLVPIIQQVAARWDTVIQKHLSHEDDPAFVMGFAIRYMGRVIIRDELWIWMLEHSGVPMQDMKDAVGRFAARDFGKGLLSGRFVVPDLSLTSTFMMGGYITALLAARQSADPDKSIDQLSELMLRSLGINATEAGVISTLPLPAPVRENYQAADWQPIAESTIR